MSSLTTPATRVPQMRARLLLAGAALTARATWMPTANNSSLEALPYQNLQQPQAHRCIGAQVHSSVRATRCTHPSGLPGQGCTSAQVQRRTGAQLRQGYRGTGVQVHQGREGEGAQAHRCTGVQATRARMHRRTGAQAHRCTAG